MSYVQSYRSHRALTLVEVLVVFVVLGTGLLIFAPLVVQVTEGARASQCQAQMRRLALAVQSFEQARGGLPAAAFVNEGRQISSCAQTGSDASIGTASALLGCFDILGRNGGPNYGWIASVLPYIDRLDIYDDIDFNSRAQDQFKVRFSLATPGDPDHGFSRRDETPVFAREIAQLICPSDGGPKAHFNGAGVPLGFMALQKTAGFAKTNYVGFSSVVHIDHFLNREGSLGGFDLGSAVGQTLSAIPDGVSHTLLLSEVRTMDVPGDSRGAWALAFPGATVISVDWHATQPGAAAYHPQPNFDPIALPNSQYLDLMMGDRQHQAQAELEGMPFLALNQGGGGSYLGAAPRSRHHGGVHAAAIDGRVGLISNQIDRYVYVYLVHTRDGQLTDFNDAIAPRQTIAQP